MRKKKQRSKWKARRKEHSLKAEMTAKRADWKKEQEAYNAT
jgi:hypothetical protein